MSDSTGPGEIRWSKADGEPRRTRLGRILAEQPEARPRCSKIARGKPAGGRSGCRCGLGLLAIWHLRRRAQLIRDRLSPPRSISFPDPPAGPESERTDD